MEAVKAKKAPKKFGEINLKLSSAKKAFLEVQINRINYFPLIILL